VFAHSAVPMVLADDDRRYPGANQLAQDALGLSFDELRKLRIDDVTPPHLVGELEEVWARLLKTGVLVGDEVAGGRSYVALPGTPSPMCFRAAMWWCFVPHAVTPADLPQNRYDTDPPGVTLSPRELEVLELAADGLDRRSIAEQLVLSAATVKQCRHRLIRQAVHDFLLRPAPS
jgi:Bacterial regulatory proteins, luxR family/PAS fold